MSNGSVGHRTISIMIASYVPYNVMVAYEIVVTYGW